MLCWNNLCGGPDDGHDSYWLSFSNKLRVQNPGLPVSLSSAAVVQLEIQSGPREPLFWSQIQ